MPIYRLPVQITSPVIGGRGVNTFHVRTGGGLGEDATLNRAIQWLEDFYIAAAAAFCTTTTFAFEGMATEVAVEDPQIREGLDTWSKAGEGGTNHLPPATQLAVTWRTASATRSGRGRTFLGPLSANISEADGTPNIGGLTLIRDAAAALVSSSAAADADGVALGVFSPTQNLLRDFTGSGVKDQFAVLRSRRD